jgi:hypothetical protein
MIELNSITYRVKHGKNPGSKHGGSGVFKVGFQSKEHKNDKCLQLNIEVKSGLRFLKIVEPQNCSGQHDHEGR